VKVFENRGLRKLFGLKWEAVTGDWKRLHNKELTELYHSAIIIQVIT
jgi:hypothetical protein